MEIVLSRLFAHFIEMYASSVNTNRGSGLHPFRFDT